MLALGQGSPVTVNQLNFAAVKFRVLAIFWVILGNFSYRNLTDDKCTFNTGTSEISDFFLSTFPCVKVLKRHVRIDLPSPMAL